MEIANEKEEKIRKQKSFVIFVKLFLAVLVFSLILDFCLNKLKKSNNNNNNNNDKTFFKALRICPMGVSNTYNYPDMKQSLVTVIHSVYGGRFTVINVNPQEKKPTLLFVILIKIFIYNFIETRHYLLL